MTAQFAGLVAAGRVQLDSAGVHAAYFRGMSVTGAGKIRAKADGVAEPRSFVNGIAFSPLGELLVDSVGPITGFSNGGTPVNSRGAVVALDAVPTGYHQGVPVGPGGVSAVGGAAPPVTIGIAQRQATDFTTPATSFAVPLPAGVPNGAKMLILFGCGNSLSVNTPAGWTAFGNNTTGLFIFQRVKDGTEGATVTVTTVGATVTVRAITYGLTGAVAGVATNQMQASGITMSTGAVSVNPAIVAGLLGAIDPHYALLVLRVNPISLGSAIVVTPPPGFTLEDELSTTPTTMGQLIVYSSQFTGVSIDVPAFAVTAVPTTAGNSRCMVVATGTPP